MFLVLRRVTPSYRHPLAIGLALAGILGACAESPATTAAADVSGDAWNTGDVGADVTNSDVIASGDANSDVPNDSATLEPYPVPDGCNPLAAEWDCLLPFPSDVFRVPIDAPSGTHRVVIGEAARLVRGDGVSIDPHSAFPVDGFSVHPPVLALFPEGVDPSDLVSPYAPFDASTGDDSTTILLDAETGARVPHFAETDPLADGDARRALILRPHVPLEHGKRYVVAVRGLRARDGSLLAAPEGFRRIRDGAVERHPALVPLAERYEADVFLALDASGIERASLQLAWDFTTATRQSVAGDMLAIREDLLQRFDEAPPSVSIVSVADDVDVHVLRHVEGTVRVPLYLDTAEPGGRLLRESDGTIASAGTVDVPFSVIVPRSLATPDDGNPGRLVIYGHGFFGGRDEHERDWLREQADEQQLVILTLDWWGMSRDDVPELTRAVGAEPSRAFAFSERLHQGMANMIAATEAAATTLHAQPALWVDDVPFYDSAFIAYYGNSQGGILGGTLVPLAPRIERAVLGVGGAGLSLMTTRSRQFATFIALMRLRVPDPLDLQKWIALATVNLDRIDPVIYAPMALTDPLPDDPGTREVLLQVGLGDADVSNLGSFLLARSLGLAHLEPVNLAIDGIPTAVAPITGSALATFDFGVDPLPGLEARPPEDGNPAHGTVRDLATAQAQIDAFLRPDGVIEATCDGRCDPE